MRCTDVAFLPVGDARRQAHCGCACDRRSERNVTVIIKFVSTERGSLRDAVNNKAGKSRGQPTVDEQAI